MNLNTFRTLVERRLARWYPDGSEDTIAMAGEIMLDMAASTPAVEQKALEAEARRELKHGPRLRRARKREYQRELMRKRRGAAITIKT